MSGVSQIMQPILSPPLSSSHEIPVTSLISACLNLERKFGWTARCVVWAVFFQLLVFSYLPSLQGPFVYDDVEAIVGNRDLRFPGEPWRIFRDHETSLHFDRRPVAGLVTLVDFQLWGLGAYGFRMTNLLLHFSTGIAIAALATVAARFQRSRFPLLFGHILALVWLLHPLATSTVSFIFQRSEILMSLFFVLSLYFMLRSYQTERSWRLQVLSLCCAFLSALSKETGLTVVMALPLFARICGNNSWKQVFTKRMRFFGVFITGFVAISIWVRSGVRFAELNQPEMALSGSWEYFRYQCPVIAHYLRLVVFPHPMSFLPRFQEIPDFLDILPYLICLTSASVGLIYYGRRQNWIWLCLGGFLIILAPTTSFVAIPLEPEAEFRMYLPLAFVLAGLLSWGGSLILRCRTSPGVVLIFSGLFFLGEFVTTLTRNKVYSSMRALWEDTIEKAPANGKSWINLAFCYLDLAEYEKARQCAESLISFGRNQKSGVLVAGGEHILAMVYLELGQTDEAFKLLEKLSKENPEDAGIQVSLAHALGASGLPERALAILRAVHPDPLIGHPAIARLYGGIYRRLGMVEQEKQMMEHLGRVQPGLSVIDLEKGIRSQNLRTGPNSGDSEPIR
jgi:protein O-mannosyl-transferase